MMKRKKSVLGKKIIGGIAKKMAESFLYTLNKPRN